jgi:hypothetical protein
MGYKRTSRSKIACRLLLLALVVDYLLLGYYKFLSEFKVLSKYSYITVVLFRHKYTLLLLNFKALLEDSTSLHLGLILNLRLKELYLYLTELPAEVIELCVYKVKA